MLFRRRLDFFCVYFCAHYFITVFMLPFQSIINDLRKMNLSYLLWTFLCRENTLILTTCQIRYSLNQTLSCVMFPLWFFIHSLFFSLVPILFHSFVLFVIAINSKNRVSIHALNFSFECPMCLYVHSVRFVASGFLLQCHLKWLFDLEL